MSRSKFKTMLLVSLDIEGIIATDWVFSGSADNHQYSISTNTEQNQGNVLSSGRKQCTSVLIQCSPWLKATTSDVHISMYEQHHYRCFCWPSCYFYHLFLFLGAINILLFAVVFTDGNNTHHTPLMRENFANRVMSFERRGESDLAGFCSRPVPQDVTLPHFFSASVSSGRYVTRILERILYFWTTSRRFLEILITRTPS